MQTYKVIAFSLWTVCIMQQLCHIETATMKIDGVPMCGIGYSKKGPNELNCHVGKGDILDYRLLRKWSAEQKGKKYSVSVFCNGGVAYMPWPLKAVNVVSLSVYGCVLEGLLSEMTNVYNVKDELTTLILSDISVEIPLKEMFEVTQHFDKISHDADCGQLTVEKMVLQNIHYDLILTPEERNDEGYRMLHYGGGRGPAHGHVKPCIYGNLKFLDESGSRVSGHYHLDLLPEHAVFPQLEVYNMSRNHLKYVPRDMQNAVSTKYPKLKTLDLSNNALTSAKFTFPVSCNLQFIDLSKNHIRSIPAKTVTQLKSMASMYVDLRYNPLQCNCKLVPFRQYLQAQYLNTKVLDTRRMLSDITCSAGHSDPWGLNEVGVLDPAFDNHCGVK